MSSDQSKRDVIYLALSCLQGRPMNDAARDLVSLAPGRVGLQLTPGCAPTDLQLDCPTRTHHGFTQNALRARVWDGSELVWQGDSMHPPLERNVPDDWQPPDGVVLETMFPGYACLANGYQLEEAMDAGRWIAVDVAHIEIQAYHGVISSTSRKRLLEYERVAEVHVSTSQEHRDSHAKLCDDTWGVEWARHRRQRGTPLVLECYMHALHEEERLAQLERLW